MSEKQFYLLQVNDALFPIGGYSHSQGLETYIQRGIVHNVDTAREYITHKIKWNLAYTELLAARLAYEAAEKKDLQELLYLEELLEASRIPMEQREAARKMGSRFAKTIEKLGLSISETGIFREYLDARKGKAVNHCCIYGVFCAEMQIPLEEALTHYLYAQTSAIVTNCVKTIPLSQTSGPGRKQPDILQVGAGFYNAAVNQRFVGKSDFCVTDSLGGELGRRPVIVRKIAELLQCFKGQVAGIQCMPIQYYHFHKSKSPWRKSTLRPEPGCYVLRPDW